MLVGRSEYFNTMFSSAFLEGQAGSSGGGGAAAAAAVSTSSRSKKAKVEGSASAVTASSSSSPSSSSSLLTITIGETTTSAFKALLRYLYTDAFEFEDKDILNVMSKAREYQLERLYINTARYCISHVCVDNVVTWLIQADEFGLEELREATLQFLGRHLAAVRANDADSLLLLKEKPDLMMEVLLAAK